MLGEIWVSQSATKVRVEGVVNGKVVYLYIGTPDKPARMPIEMFKNYFRKA